MMYTGFDIGMYRCMYSLQSILLKQCGFSGAWLCHVSIITIFARALGPADTCTICSIFARPQRPGPGPPARDRVYRARAEAAVRSKYLGST